MSLQVIGTGFGRTGTTSLKTALEQIGFGKCYHMYELLHHPEDLKYFQQATAKEPVDWDTLFTGYLSACDFPVILFYKELMEKYPDAKLIHTTRDPESWYKSFKDTIMWAVKPSLGRILKTAVTLPFSQLKRQRLQVLKYNGEMMNELFGKDLSKEHVIDCYNKFNETVLKSLPKDRSLIYSVKEGWKPLCDFLGVPVPATPFPQTNSTEEFISNVKKF